jgi:small subunit ribosomal protein S20
LPQRHPSAQKRHRQSLKKKDRNRAVRTEMRHEIRKVREIVAKGDGTTAVSELKAAVKIIAKAATKGVIHKNTASRYISRLSKQVAGATATA